MVPETGLVLTRFPFRVGRASREEEPDPLDVNDLNLPDTAPFNVSRNHFSIGQKGEHVVVSNRGSYLGTVVNGQVVGGHRKTADAVLDEGDKR